MVNAKGTAAGRGRRPLLAFILSCISAITERRTAPPASPTSWRGARVIGHMRAELGVARVSETAARANGTNQGTA